MLNFVILDQDDGFIELGAQWIHGQKANILYDFAHQHDLTTCPTESAGFEGTGKFCTESGSCANCDILHHLIAHLDEEKNLMDSQSNESVYDYFKQKFDDFINSEQHITPSTRHMLLSVFRWFILFEAIDNSSDSLANLSSLSYTEWKNYEGLDLVNLKRGYKTVVDLIASQFPIEKMLHLGTAVKSIEIVRDETDKIGNIFKVKVHTGPSELEHPCSGKPDFVPSIIENQTYTFDSVLLTSSVGFLKKALDEDFFRFDMPHEKVDVIRSLGFGTINKIFLFFDTPFWEKTEKGFQLLWEVDDEHSYNGPSADGTSPPEDSLFPRWAHCIQGFDPVQGHPNMLMAWIGSYGAQEVESCSDEEVGLVCTQILRKFVPASCQVAPIQAPSQVFVSRWHSHPYILGAYSNRTLAYHNLDLPKINFFIDLLSEPVYVGNILKIGPNEEDSRSVWDSNTPLVLFAGEATDRDHYSTTDGAYRSGLREAKRLFNFYRRRSF